MLKKHLPTNQPTEMAPTYPSLPEGYTVSLSLASLPCFKLLGKKVLLNGLPVEVSKSDPTEEWGFCSPGQFIHQRCTGMNYLNFKISPTNNDVASFYTSPVFGTAQAPGKTQGAWMDGGLLAQECPLPPGDSRKDGALENSCYRDQTSLIRNPSSTTGQLANPV